MRPGLTADLPHQPPAPAAVALENRAVLELSGPDRVAFLQGLVSNDVARTERGLAVHAALLTPQGKFLHDLFLVPLGERLLIDCEAARRDDLLRRLRMYRLRSKVELADAADRYAVHAVIGAGAAVPGLGAEPGATAPLGNGVACVDPRLAALGLRLILPAGEAPGFPAAPFDAWDRLRLALGVPDGSRDLVPEKSILLENGFDELNGVSWDKGCYMGQELTARTRYRGLVKKRLTPVAVEGPLPEPGTVVMAGDRDAGEVRSGFGAQALALLRTEEVAKAAEAGTPLTAGGAVLRPLKAAWARD